MKGLNLNQTEKMSEVILKQLRIELLRFVHESSNFRINSSFIESSTVFLIAEITPLEIFSNNHILIL